MNKQIKAILKFASEVQERAYWESHDSTKHLDWAKAKTVSLPNLKPTTASRTETYFKERQARGDLTGFDAWLAASPDVPPEPRDALK